MIVLLGGLTISIQTDSSNGMSAENWIALISVLVAVITVVASHIANYYASRRQNELLVTEINSAFASANKQVIAPMRQAWINNLRELLSAFSHITKVYYSNYPDVTVDDVYAIGSLSSRIVFMLNPSEEEHQKLEQLINVLIKIVGHNSFDGNQFLETHAEFRELSRAILKQEWNRVKNTREI